MALECEAMSAILGKFARTDDLFHAISLSRAR